MKTKILIQTLGLVIFMMIGAPLIGSVVADAFDADLGNSIMCTGAAMGSMIVLNAVSIQYYGYALFANNPDISALAAYAGKYEQKLFSTLENSMSFMSQVEVHYDVKSSENMTKLEVSDGARPYVPEENFANGNDLTYTPRKLEVFTGKRELKVEPLKYRPTWMGQVMSKKINPMEIPFAGYVWERVIKKLGAEINNKTFYKGFDKADAVLFDAGDTYAVGEYIYFTPAGQTYINYYKCVTATNAAESPTTHAAKWQMVNAEAIFPGLEVDLLAGIASSDLEEVSSGVISDGPTALAAMKEVYRAHDPVYKDDDMIMYVSFTDYEFLMDEVEDKFYKYTGMPNFKDLVKLPGTNNRCEILPVTWLANSRRLICAPKGEEIIFGTDSGDDFQNINTVQSELWTLKAGIVFTGGVKVRNFDTMKVGDQD